LFETIIHEIFVVFRPQTKSKVTLFERLFSFALCEKNSKRNCGSLKEMQSAPAAAAFQAEDEEKANKVRRRRPGTRERIYERYEAYASETQFHGFGQIATSGNWVEQLLWLFVLFVCVALTFKDITASFKDYFYGETVSTTKIERVDELVFPNVTMCVDIQIERFAFENVVDARNASDVRVFLAKNVIIACSSSSASSLEGGLVISLSIEPVGPDR